MRKTASNLIWLVGLGTLAGSLGSGCADLGNDCEYLLTCVDSTTGGAESTGGMGDGDGDGDTGGISTGGTEETGGNSGGGAEDTGGAENTGGMGGIPFSCDECTGAAEPVCDEAEEECVQCLPAVDESECVGTNTPVCGPENTCVQCTEDRDNACTTDRPYCSPENECVQCLSGDECDADAPVCSDNECTGCEDNEDCSGYADDGLGVCNTETGSCEECLTEADCNGNVCDPATWTCTEVKAREKYDCYECQYDAECQQGQLCVEQTAGEMVLGTFCLWRKDGRPETADGCFEGGRPFAKPLDVKSVDGVEAAVCTLATTSCPAYLDYRKRDICTGPTDDDACGVQGVADGVCELLESTPLCTYPCGGDEDCKLGFTCTGSSFCSL